MKSLAVDFKNRALEAGCTYERHINYVKDYLENCAWIGYMGSGRLPTYVPNDSSVCCIGYEVVGRRNPNLDLKWNLCGPATPVFCSLERCSIGHWDTVYSEYLH